MIIRIIDALEVVVAPQESAMQAADPEHTSSNTLWPDDYDKAQGLRIIRMWSDFEPELITDD